MKRILAFGDSNTWGLKPLENTSSPAERYDTETRWTSLLQKYLGTDAFVIEQGLNGRNTGIDDLGRGYKLNLNAQSVFSAIVESSTPLDLIIIMLGTNDCHLRYDIDEKVSANNIEELIKIAQSNIVVGDIPHILIISPVPLRDEPLNEVNTALNIAMSHKLAPLYEEICSKYDNVSFLDAQSAVSLADGCDGIHLSEKAHKDLSMLIFEKVKEIL